MAQNPAQSGGARLARGNKMLLDYKCQNKKCGIVREEYYATSKVPAVIRCVKCGGIMKKCFHAPNMRMGGSVAGYEKHNDDHLTLGKAIDGRQQWV